MKRPKKKATPPYTAHYGKKKIGTFKTQKEALRFMEKHAAKRGKVITWKKAK